MAGKPTETEHELIGGSFSPHSSEEEEQFAALNPTAANASLEGLLMHRLITPAQYAEIGARERPLPPLTEGGYLSGKRIKDVPPGDEIMDKWGG